MPFLSERSTYDLLAWLAWYRSMDSATLPGDSDSDGHTPLWGLRPADLDEAPAAGPHIMETISISARNGESSGTKAPVSAADCDSGNGDDETDSSFSGKMSSRAYQLEMLDESLKRNVIVAVRHNPHPQRLIVLFPY